MIKKVFILSVLLAFAVVGLDQAKATALSGADFNPGRIMDDAVFYDPDSMQSTEIQEFLESKVPVCDTDGTQPYAGTTRAEHGTSIGYPPPYTCLKDFVQEIPYTSAAEGLCDEVAAGTKSAAQIIQEVATACGINPQVLIVILQREQSLVTDDWPWSIQYRSATGYGCPESADCNSEYYGFFNQLYNTSKAFKRYAANPTFFSYRAGRDNTIQYSPNPACGNSTVFIENQATASLYIYNPYQPNQAALDNLYGTGDSCSSYGNRNFWRLFNDWFGSTLASQLTLEMSLEKDGSVITSPVKYNSYVKLSWNSDNTDSCDLEPGDLWPGVIGYGVDYEIQFFAQETTTFTVTCTGTAGSVSKSVTLEVLPKPSAQILIDGNNTTKVAYGTNIDLTWTTENVDECIVMPGDLAGTYGNIQLTAAETTLYTLECSGQYGETESQAYVLVMPPTFADLNAYLAGLSSGTGRNKVNLSSVVGQVSQAERRFDQGQIQQAEELLAKSIQSMEKLAQKNSITPSIYAEYERLAKLVINSLIYNVTISTDGCYLTAKGTPGSMLEFGGHEGPWRRGYGDNVAIPASGEITVSTGGTEGFTVYGIIRDADGNKLAENSQPGADNNCPPFSEF